MTRSAGRRADARGSSQRPLELLAHRLLGVAGLAFVELLADAQDRSQSELGAAQQLAADELVVSPWSRRRSRVTDDAQVASPSTIGAEISPVYAPNGSAWMFWTPTSTSVSCQRPRDRARQTKGGQMTRVTPATSVAAAMPLASSAGLERRRVHLPVGGDDHRPCRVMSTSDLVRPRRRVVERRAPDRSRMRAGPGCATCPVSRRAR